jgi:hypothetical protein
MKCSWLAKNIPRWMRLTSISNPLIKSSRKRSSRMATDSWLSRHVRLFWHPMCLGVVFWTAYLPTAIGAQTHAGFAIPTASAVPSSTVLRKGLFSGKDVVYPLHGDDMHGLRDSLSFGQAPARRNFTRILAVADEGHHSGFDRARSTVSHDASQAFAVRPAEIVGVYEGDFETGSEWMEIEQRASAIHLSLTTTTESGCIGSVEGEAKLDGNHLTLNVWDVAYEQMYPEEGRAPVFCTVTATFDPTGVVVGTNRCESFHGVPCEFWSGPLKKLP